MSRPHSDWQTIEMRTMTPPHAKICRERAVAAISHPALRLPPLPVVPQARESKEPQSADGTSDSGDSSTTTSPMRPSAPLRPSGRAFAPARPPSQSVPTERSVRGASSFAQQPSFQLGEDEDLADFI